MPAKPYPSIQEANESLATRGAHLPYKLSASSHIWVGLILNQNSFNHRISARLVSAVLATTVLFGHNSVEGTMMWVSDSRESALQCRPGLDSGCCLIAPRSCPTPHCCSAQAPAASQRAPRNALLVLPPMWQTRGGFRLKHPETPQLKDESTSRGAFENPRGALHHVCTRWVQGEGTPRVRTPESGKGRGKWGAEAHQLLGEGVPHHAGAETDAKELQAAPDVRPQPLRQCIVAHLRMTVDHKNAIRSASLQAESPSDCFIDHSPGQYKL